MWCVRWGRGRYEVIAMSIAGCTRVLAPHPQTPGHHLDVPTPVIPSTHTTTSHSRDQEEKDYYDDLQMELELADDDAPVLYKLGETFFSLSLPAAKKQLRADMKRYDGEISSLNKRADECTAGMKELKVLL